MLKTLPLAIALASAIPATVALALTRPAPTSSAAVIPPTPRTIAVAGDAQVSVVPDRATFTIIVDGIDADRARAQRQAQERVTKVLTALAHDGVKPEGIKSTPAQLTPEYATDRHGNPLYLHVRRWTARHTITVCVQDLRTMNAIFGDVIDAGATIAGDVTFDTSRLEELRAQARVLAADAAKKKARALTDVLGGELGLPLTITETPPGWSGPTSYKNAAESWRDGAFVDGSFAAGQMTVSAHVDVTFSVD